MSMTRMSSSADQRATESLSESIAGDAAQLGEASNELVGASLQKRAADSVGDRGARSCPASWAQQRLWFLNQLQEDSCAYNMSFALRLRGFLDQEALASALNALIARHESLRTTFTNEDGEPRQVIAAEGRISLTRVDLQGQDAEELEKQVHLNKLAELSETFDLRAGPLIRGRLLLLAVDEQVLLITLHHIISDGWSMGVLFRELGELYAAHIELRPHSLDPLEVQYADYAQWQRQWLAGEELERQIAYWRKHLDGADPQIELPTDRPRPAIRRWRSR